MTKEASSNFKRYAVWCVRPTVGLFVRLYITELWPNTSTIPIKFGMRVTYTKVIM